MLEAPLPVSAVTISSTFATCSLVREGDFMMMLMFSVEEVTTASSNPAAFISPSRTSSVSMAAVRASLSLSACAIASAEEDSFEMMASR